ncbi:hypothetical protein DM02DRAFT_636155 [Periconia macrospinosa]|uniref:Uncharacterized protein n=1 Tax=Periconia macrospinosa TaxID=97972 RepID=A0A2V1D066_9PLEO|nr:hypothetical protein DM02DRAFT_636155 [Periconia macrospinosa]
MAYSHHTDNGTADVDDLSSNKLQFYEMSINLAWRMDEQKEPVAFPLAFYHIEWIVKPSRVACGERSTILIDAPWSSRSFNGFVWPFYFEGLCPSMIQSHLGRETDGYEMHPDSRVIHVKRDFDVQEIRDSRCANTHLGLNVSEASGINSINKAGNGSGTSVVD